MTRFWKLSGGGNDFVALVEPRPEDLLESRIRSWCRRGLSIGADGVFAIRRQHNGGVGMQHWNADGSRASLCLNGTRCAARLAFHLGWASEQVSLHTEAGPVQASDRQGDGVRLTLEVPQTSPHSVVLSADGTVFNGWLTRVGVPHLVLLWDDGLAEAPVEALGKALVHHSGVGSEGANVNFVVSPEPRQMEIRTYERGVYAETLACGTGVLSSAWVLVSAGRAELPLDVLTAGGFRFRVEGEVSAGRLQSWSLAGDARLVAEGEIHSGAETMPEPPRWSRRPDPVPVPSRGVQ